MKHLSFIFFFSFRHVSKFRDNAKDEYTKQKVDHKTMGQAKVPLLYSFFKLMYLPVIKNWE
jgi:hypothetical protein